MIPGPNSNQDPDRFCIDCGHPWGVFEEICPDCDFDPVNNLDDAEANDRARQVFQTEETP